jgi:hypothetical protein
VAIPIGFCQSLDKEWAREKEIEKVKKGTHPFLGGKVQRKSNNDRLSNGTHNFKGENSPNNIKMTCPHCGKTGGKPNMINHHFDRCKIKQWKKPPRRLFLY